MAFTSESLIEEIERLPDHRLYGRVASVLGLLIEVAGLDRVLSILGGRCTVEARGGRRVPCEVIGFRQGRALVLPFGSLEGIGLGCKAEVADADPMIRPSDAWLGRVVNALGQPVDEKGPLTQGPTGLRRLRAFGSAAGARARPEARSSGPRSMPPATRGAP